MKTMKLSLSVLLTVQTPRSSNYSKTRKYVYTLKNNNSANTLDRWRGFLEETPFLLGCFF